MFIFPQFKILWFLFTLLFIYCQIINSRPTHHFFLRYIILTSRGLYIRLSRWWSYTFDWQLVSQLLIVPLHVFAYSVVLSLGRYHSPHSTVIMWQRCTTQSSTTLWACQEERARWCVTWYRGCYRRNLTAALAPLQILWVNQIQGKAEAKSYLNATWSSKTCFLWVYWMPIEFQCCFFS